MKRNGFTLIEIIVCIALLSVVFVSIVIVNNKNMSTELKTIENNSKLFDNALEIYLNNHEDIAYNLNKNVKGGIVTLEVLKDEGLIKDNILPESDYKKYYYFLSNSVLLDNDSSLSAGTTECESNVVGIQTIKSWDLSNISTDKIIYICPRNDSSSSTEGSDTTNTNIVNVYNKDGYYIAKGSSPKNYVKFEVNAGNSNSDFAYFPDDSDKDLWRIVSINEDGNIKLVYHKNVESNNSINYSSSNSLTYYTDCDGNKKINQKTIYKLKSEYDFNYATRWCGKKCTTYKRGETYVLYNDNKGWSILDLFDTNIYSNEDNNKISINDRSKLSYLYKNIANHDWIRSQEYNYGYTFSNGIYEMKLGYISSNALFGTITMDDINASILFEKSWLYSEDVLSGVTSETTDNGTITNRVITLNNSNPRKNSITEIFEYKNVNYNCSTIRYLYNGHYLSTYHYLPVITLKSNIKLKEDTSCSKDNSPGSKSCPYLLEKETIEDESIVEE